ncbi:MAG: SdrD B-like domain-containing protein, partial [Kiritimatiellia bacterium]|nr:SdrD B-like domain-containing protein [Kiritimatiellia bacterium]
MFAIGSVLSFGAVSNGWLRRAGVCAALALVLTGAPSAGAVTVTRTSGAVMQVDIPNGLTCAYLSYVVSNDTATAYSNIWVKADAFTGGVVSLGGGDNGLCHIDDLAPGAHKTAFFYVCALSVTTLPQSHTVNVYEGHPDSGVLLVNPIFSLTVDDASANNSSKVYAVTYDPAQPTVGGTVQVTVVGDAGNVRRQDVVNFTPAAYANWNAAAFELIHVTLSLTNKNGQSRLISDYLELPLEYSTWAAGAITYTASYTFRALIETEQNTPVSPITYATQGNASSHTTTTGYGSFAPIQSPTNTTVLAKLVNVTQLYTNEIVTYTVRFTNSGPNDVEIDRIVDSLPTGMSYVPGSSLFHGQSVLDPAISGTLLAWSEADLIPANSSRDFNFQARASIAGYPTNRVTAYVGGESTLIDTTLRTDDTVPGGVTVRTLLPPTAADDSFSVVEDGILTVPAPGVLANDSDLNGFTITVIAHTQPVNGDLAINADGAFTYTPAPDTFGGDSFTYTITNDNGRVATAVVNLTVLPVNDAPGFTVGADQSVLMNAGAQAVASWATGISKGPANESGQALNFAVTNDNTALFSAQPAVSADGTLTYTPAPGLSGIATVTLYLQDDGGTDNGGLDGSAAQTFTITVIAYSIGNWVFKDMNNDGIRDFGDNGVEGVRMALFAAADGQPSGDVLRTTVTDAGGYYRFDHLAAGTYVVVADVAESQSLDGLTSSSGHNASLAISGDLHDHGRDAPVTVGGIVNGIAGVPITVGEGLQPYHELVSESPGAGQHGPLGDAYDNLVMDFGFTPVYSVGNRVFFDDDFDMYQDNGETGVPGVPLFAFAAGADGLPMGEPLAFAVTDANGWYRLDGLVKGTYVVVLDREAAAAANADLKPYTSTIGSTNDMMLAGDRWDHGWYHPLITLGPVTNGYASSPVELGPAMQPLGEQTNGVSGAGAHSPYGDDRDNLVVDFGLVRTFCIGNRVFLDDGSGGGTADNGIQDGTEPGISNVALRIFAADANGEPTGDALVIGTDNLTAALTDANGWYRFFRLAPG